MFTGTGTATPNPLDPTCTADYTVYASDPPEDVITVETPVRGGVKGSKVKRKAQRKARRNSR